MNKLQQNAVAITLYKQVIGNSCDYMILAPRASWAELGEPNAFRSIPELIKRYAERQRQDDLLKMLRQSIREVHTETWLYRPDLSYFRSPD